MLMDSYYSFQDDPMFQYGEMPMWAFSPDLASDAILASPEPMLVRAEEELPVLALRPSAFGKYVGEEFESSMECLRPVSGGDGARNIHRRMIEIMTRIGKEIKEESNGVEWSRGFRHMMRERHRREKVSQSYADLYSMMAPRSKRDKNSIVQSAAIYIRELKGARDQLQRRNNELSAKILGHDASKEVVKVKFDVESPTSNIDSMIGALRCLKATNVKARTINFSGHTLSAVLSIETKIPASEVEKAVEAALKEVETKRPSLPFPESSNGWAPSSHVENVF